MQDATPGDRLRWAQAKKGERGLGDDRHADDNGKLKEYQWHHIGKDVQVHDAQVRGSRYPRRLNEGPLAQRQHLGADQPRHGAPGKQRHSQYHDQQTRFEQQYQNQRKGLERDAVHDINHTHQHRLGTATEVTGDQAHVGPDQHDQGSTDETHQQCNPRTVHVLTIQITTQVVGAQPVLAGGWCQAIDETVRTQCEVALLSDHQRAQVTLLFAWYQAPLITLA